jgi:two-component system NtrC family response regulator
MDDFRILLIDDEPAQIASIQSYLKRRGYSVETAGSGNEGLTVFKKNLFDAVFTDFRMPDISGLDVVKAIRSESPETPVIVITAFSQVEDAVEIMKAGAFDYMTKPIDLELLGSILEKVRERNYLISENKMLREQLAEKRKFDSIIYQSPEMEKVLSTVARVAKSKASVLIRGESGTGKEIVARAIHQASARADKPMVTVNCAALTESLLESELFGHEKGAFTGAVKQHLGRFEQADGGTLFIDEVGDIPPATQVKLLRAIQQGEFERVGGNETLKVDVRIVAATHRNLENMIRENQFREDLFYRINVIGIEIPPLRERKEDIPVLIRHFLDKFSKENGKKIKGISKETMDILMKYSYPGNIRELENIIESSVVLAREEIITTADLPSGIYQPPESAMLNANDFSIPYPEKVMAFEKSLIINALKEKKGNQSKAAELLGISERHLRSRMQKIGVVNEYK